MKLKQYLKDNKIRMRDFAKIIGVHELTVLRLRDGETNPSLQTALKIRDATEGQVGIEDLVKESPCET